jgi:hypothetical protein
MRIVVGLDPGAPAAAIDGALRARGATDVRPPAPSLPDVMLTEFPDQPEEAVLTDVRAIPGVRYAEVDVLRTMLE